MSFRKIAAAAVALLLVLSLAACGGKRAETNEIKLPTPVPADKFADYTQTPETLEHVETLLASFSELPESAAEDFVLETVDGRLTVKSYVGTAKTVRVPERVGDTPVSAIADGAFADAAIEKLYLPDGIVLMGKGILAGVKGLTALRTPLLGATANEEAPYLGYLFYKPTAQAPTSTYQDNAVHVPASLTYLELARMETLGDHALFDCNDLEVLRLPEGMKRIGSFALYNCNRLLAISNTEALEELGDHALMGCSLLTRVELGDAMSRIGLGAFEGCAALRRMRLPFAGGSATENAYLAYIFGAEHPEFSEGYYPPYLVEITLTSAKKLADCALYECRSITTLHLPEGLEEIGVRALAGCERLTSITLPASLGTVRENAFFGCYSLATVTVAEGSALTSVGINAFYNCISLTEITLPETLTEIAPSTFAGCRALTAVDAQGVRTVGAQAFRDCTALTSVKLAENPTVEQGNDAVRDLLK